MCLNTIMANNESSTVIIHWHNFSHSQKNLAENEIKWELMVNFSPVQEPKSQNSVETVGWKTRSLFCMTQSRCVLEINVFNEWVPGLTSVPAMPPEVLVVWQGAVAVSPVCQAAFLLHDVQLVLIIWVWSGLHHIVVVSYCAKEHTRGRG